MSLTTRFHVTTVSVFSLIALLGAGCQSSNSTPGSAQAPRGDVGTDICGTFTPDFVHSATGKTIVRVEPSKIAGLFTCDYFTEYKEDYYHEGTFKAPGGPHITIALENLSVANQKIGLESMGAKIETDPRINMEHFVVHRTKDNSIWEVALVINPMRFVWTDVTAGAITDDETILFAAKMADLIQGRSNVKIEKNPVDLTPPKVDTSPTQEQTVRAFLEAIANKKTSDALAMMDANAETKAGWKTNFEQLKSLTITKIEPIYEEEWTAERQSYKAELEVKLVSGNASMGWVNGKNFRWITVEKTGDKWLVHELANNP